MGGLLFLHGRRLLLSRKGFFSLQSRRLLHVCIVGSGPAGCYTAEKMLKADEKSQVDILDRLPTPFGLVRSGVAPDHPETKIVVNQFSRVAANERCSFFGNVSLGNSVSLLELREIYDVVVLAYGAESDRSLGIPGEDLCGIYSAREFVWWYNGHPDFCNLDPDLRSTDTAVVLGQGNVALDVARILLRPTTELSTTDISSHALVSLQKSSIRKVYLVGRRGPAQAACTAKELRELLGTKNLNVHIREADLVTSPADEEELKNSRIQRRVYELLVKAATSSHPYPVAGQRELHFLFFRKPERFLSSDDGCRVSGARLEKTCLKASGGPGRQVSVGTGEFEDLHCGFVLKSIGYKSLPVEGLPFDNHRGVVPNIKGRVICSHQPEMVEHGLYVVGWLKRGPTGIIATNLYCAEETVSYNTNLRRAASSITKNVNMEHIPECEKCYKVTSILEDIAKGSFVQSTKPGRQGLQQLLEHKNVRFVPFSGWEKIDSRERMEGQLRNKPREKITSWGELLEVANR